MFDFAIIGAGVIGSMLARELARYPLRILILEAENDVSCGASRANSGIIHGGYDAKHGTLKGRFSRKGNQMYDQLEAELKFGLRRVGSLVVTLTAAEITTLQHLQQNGSRNCVDDLAILDSSELQSIQPQLTDEIKNALHCPSAGLVSPYELTIALAENAVANGATLQLAEPVVAIEKNGSSWLLATPAAGYQARNVINCAGSSSAMIARLIGDNSFAINLRKGDYIIFDRSYQHDINKIIFRCPTKLGKGILLTQTVAGNLLIGPNSLAIESPAERRPALDSLYSIYQSARKIYPCLDLGKAIRVFSGVRAISSTGDFIIRAANCSNFYHVAGIDSPGITAAPAIC